MLYLKAFYAKRTHEGTTKNSCVGAIQTTKGKQFSYQNLFTHSDVNTIILMNIKIDLYRANEYCEYDFNAVFTQ